MTPVILNIAVLPYIVGKTNSMSMKALEIKKEILKCGKAKHQSVIDDYRRQIKELRSGEAEDLDDQMDLQQMAFNNEVNGQINRLAEQLNFAVDEMNTLNRIMIEDPLHECVTLGSVVETDKRTFFVSVSIEEFDVFGKEFYGLSQKTPLYAQMKDKQVGDEFTLNDMSYSISRVY